jgi:phage/plasmid-associated DNA primase
MTNSLASRPRPRIAFLDSDRKLSPELLDLAREILKAPSNALAARLVAKILNDDEPETLIAERLALSGRADFYILDGVEHVPFDTVKKTVSQILEKTVRIALESLEPETEGAAIKELYAAAGKARQKARSNDFINGVLPFLADEVLISGGIPWNASPECIATSTKILDYSGPELIVRDRRPGEYFRDRVPCSAEEIANATAAPKFDRFLEMLFHHADTRHSARECLALCISGKPSKTVQIWNNAEGDGGKTTLVDFMRALVPGRAVMAKNALILWKGDPSARRFGEIELQGSMMVFFDEPSGTFDVCQIKRYTSLGTIRGEAKGQDSIEFPQTWGGFSITCNELPHFFPANDGGFLSRVFVLLFSTIFYPDDASYKRRIEEGISPARLKPAGDKAAILADLLTERPAIIASLARTWIEMRSRGGKPYESAECARAKETYRTANDTAQLFFSAYFIRDESGAVDYGTVKDAWIEFSGEAKPSMRDIVAMLTKRYPFITPTRSHGARRLKGVSLKTENDPEAKENGSSGDAGDPLPDFQVRERKNQEKDIRNGKDSSRSPASPDIDDLFPGELENLAPQSPALMPSSPSTVSTPLPTDADLKARFAAADEAGKFHGLASDTHSVYMAIIAPDHVMDEQEHQSVIDLLAFVSDEVHHHE